MSPGLFSVKIEGMKIKPLPFRGRGWGEADLM